MRMRTVFGLVAMLVATATAYAQETHQPSLAEVRFSDGSIVKMTLQQTDVEVKTKYGKLSIPFNEIRRIEFGLHVPPEMSEQIATSVKRLASEVYKERDIASKNLLEFGHFAFPSLQRMSKSNDSEVAHRATELMKQMSERVAPDLLKLREEDVIHTTEFTVVGKITSQTLKTHSPHFGEVSLKLGELRVMQVRPRCGKGELVMDATKYGSALDQWYNTAIMVDAGQRILITSEGKVDLWPQGPGQYVVDPKGYNAVGKGGQFMAGALIAKVGEKGKAFHVGERYNDTTNEEGMLFLQIVPSSWNNTSTGSYKVSVQTK